MKKSRFLQQDITFLGYRIFKGEVLVSENGLEKLKGLVNSTNTAKKVQSAIGLLGYFRQFIKNFASKVKVLYQIGLGKSGFDKDKVRNEIKKLIDEIEKSGILRLPDFNNEFYIGTDASNEGIGGILKQRIDKKDCIIRCVSRLLKKKKKNYSTIEKEILAIVFTIRKSQQYLLMKLIIKSDHRPLKWLMSLKNPKGRVARWILFLN